MCFSANISFLAAALLTLIGLISVYKAKIPSQIMFASIPLLFAIQQFSEGIVWLTQSGTFINTAAAYVFITFAMLIWPIWMPSAILAIERIKNRRNILYTLLAIGIIWVLYLLYYLLNYPMIVEQDYNHIKYVLNPANKSGLRNIIAYLIPAALPFLVSSIKNMWKFGVLIIASCFAAYAIWTNYFISIWCFFAALISIFVIKIILQENKS